MRIGEHQELKVLREAPQGFYLGDAESDVLLPRSQCPPELNIGDKLRVFVLTDSEDRPIATRKQPLATVGEFAKLKVVSTTGSGAFLDWGLDKDLFCPIREQQPRMREGEDHLVRIYLDERSGRVVCSNRLGRFLKSGVGELKPGQRVKILVGKRLPGALTVIIDGQYQGVLFKDEWHERLELGDERDAFIKSVRADEDQIAVSLRPQGYAGAIGERQKLLDALQSAGGKLKLSDKSSPEEIHRLLGLSKSSFKKLIGTLYKEGKILLTPDHIVLKD